MTDTYMYILTFKIFIDAGPPHLKSDIYNHINNPIDWTCRCSHGKSTSSSTATVFQLHNLKQLSRFVAYKMVLYVQKHRFQAGQFCSSVYRQLKTLYITFA